MKNKISPYLLDRYLKGNCTPNEEVRIKEWYDSFDSEEDYISALSELKKTKIRNRIHSRITEDLITSDFGSYVVKRRNKRIIRSVSKIGIAAVIVISFGVIAFHWQHNHSHKIIEPQRETMINNTRRIQQLTLNDGSDIWLSPGARITYEKKFSGNSRKVSMAGEAFFEVTKNVNKPFIIYSKDIITKVWGTSFRVRDSYEQSFADVAVVTGKVSVSATDPKTFAVKNPLTKNQENEVMIYPSQQATFIKREKLLHIQYKKGIKELNIWKKANLNFDNSQMKAVIPVLNREFGVNLIAADHQINEYELSADFNGLNFPQIMEILKKTLNISYDMNEKTIILKTSE